MHRTTNHMDDTKRPELYAVYEVLKTEDYCITYDNIKISKLGSEHNPRTQSLRCERQGQVSDFKGYWCAEHVFHALNKARNSEQFN